MSSKKHTNKVYSTHRNIWKTSLMTLPMMFILIIFMTGGNLSFSNNHSLLAFVITYVFFASSFFLMLYTGKTDKFRAIIFILFAVFLSFTFINNLIDMRGSMALSNADFLQCKVPLCHLVIPMLIVPAAITKSIIFPGSILQGFASIASMIVLWLGGSLALGRGFCSWGCFYGGWDEAFSRISKKPRIKKITSKLRWFPFAVLLMVVIASALTLSPVYCGWLCPFKAVTEFEPVTSVETLVKTILFVALFAGLVVVLPILTKKRIQCTYFCPMGALMSFFNRINIFGIKINQKKCTQCKVCVRVCPFNAIDPETLKLQNPNMCAKCGKCIDACPQQAIHYKVKGSSPEKHLTASRNLFLFSSFLFLAVFSSGAMQNGIIQLLKWFT